MDKKVKCLFIDNFENGLDQSKWNYEIGGHGWGNKELQYYTDDPEFSSVKDGNLVLKIKKQNYDKNNFVSTKITTYGKESFKYGSFRICAKLPTKKGLWPAF